ncbi:MAG: HEAT repeat domain-containing protein [Desulfobacteraceae bacterium]|nr:HEAT repeat domain-containing protein [Desulfobacteraceae bacterium]MBC2756312.1 HEAT repeat domain-containing protein [Desulfobacteraceae bacterium]
MELKGRRVKKHIKALLQAEDFETSLQAIFQYPPRLSVNFLFSFFYSKEEIIKWRSIAAMGRVVSRLADENMESARVIMRRLMWNLNDESGGIGWGSAEAMGEIMALHPGLADEFSSILRSYIRPDENFLEYEMLQRGVVWCIGRLAEVYPEKLTETDSFLLPFLESGDAIHRGYAAWALGNLKSLTAAAALECLTQDKAQILFFSDLQLKPVTVGLLAKEALVKIWKEK